MAGAKFGVAAGDAGWAAVAGLAALGNDPTFCSPLPAPIWTAGEMVGDGVVVGAGVGEVRPRGEFGVPILLTALTGDEGDAGDVAGDGLSAKAIGAAGVAGLAKDAVLTLAALPAGLLLKPVTPVPGEDDDPPNPTLPNPIGAAGEGGAGEGLAGAGAGAGAGAAVADEAPPIWAFSCATTLGLRGDVGAGVGDGAGDVLFPKSP